MVWPYPSPTGGHWGCLHPVAVVNSVAVNRGVRIAFRDSTFHVLGLHPEVELLDPVVIPCF